MRTRPDGRTYTPKLVDGMDFLRQWRTENIEEYEYIYEYQNPRLEEVPMASGHSVMSADEQRAAMGTAGTQESQAGTAEPKTSSR